MTFSELRARIIEADNYSGYVYQEKEPLQMRDKPAVPLVELAGSAEKGNRVSEWLNPKTEPTQEHEFLGGIGAALGGLSAGTEMGISLALQEQEMRYRQAMYERMQQRQLAQVQYTNMPPGYYGRL